MLHNFYEKFSKSLLKKKNKNRNEGGIEKDVYNKDQCVCGNADEE